MFIFISKNLLAVVQRVTSVQQQIHHGWRAPWPPVAPQKSQKSTLFALHFEAENERKSQDRLKRGRLPLFRGLSSQKYTPVQARHSMDMLTTVRRMSLLINLAHHPMLRITSIRLDFGFHLTSPCRWAYGNTVQQKKWANDAN
jgi:hypothetical protein